jgi:hypothetical protein
LSPLKAVLELAMDGFALPLLGLIEIGLQNGTTIFPLFGFFKKLLCQLGFF